MEFSILMERVNLTSLWPKISIRSCVTCLIPLLSGIPTPVMVGVIQSILKENVLVSGGNLPDTASVLLSFYYVCCISDYVHPVPIHLPSLIALP
jgi:hypothetical protein